MKQSGSRMTEDPFYALEGNTQSASRSLDLKRLLLPCNERAAQKSRSGSLATPRLLLMSLDREKGDGDLSTERNDRERRAM